MMKATYLVMFMAAGVLETGAFSVLPCTTRGRMLGKPRAHAARPALRMQVRPETDEKAIASESESTDQGAVDETTSTFMGTKNFVSDGGDWFQKTTAADREQRINNDPLSPLKSSTTIKCQPSAMRGIERESNDWYVSQERKRSMFGRTLNPLTGSFDDIKDGDNVQTLNPLEDPIFYVIVIFLTPILVMFGAAQSCVVYALSLAFGVECPVDY